MSRMNVVASLILILLLVVALGSCFPQLSSPIKTNPERLALWQMGVQARYGGLTDLLAAIGLFHWFASPVFIISLALLALSTLVCTLDRWRAIWRRAFHRPVHTAEVTFQAMPYRASLNAPTMINRPQLVGESLEKRGFRVQTETTEGVVYLRGDRNGLAPLGTLVTHLAVLLLFLGAILSSWLGWQEELTVDLNQTVEVGRGSDLAVRLQRFAIERYPNGSVSAYKAQVAVVEKGQIALSGQVQVNRPLSYNGISLHLRGYGGTDRYSIILLAVRDPGYGPVIAAGFLLLLGMTISFNFPHCWIQARIEPDGPLRLAGRAERRACDFEREFRAMVTELKRSTIT